MERALVSMNPRKRKAVVSDDEEDDGGGIEKACRFKILLPNGTSVELTLRDPKPEMPFGDFISLVRDKYLEARKQSESIRKKRHIDWKAGALFLEDGNDVKIRNVVNLKNYKPHKCHILRLRDGSSDLAKYFENMWDLTPDTEMLLELPEEYSFETALADLIDNSLQAVWSNGETQRRLIRLFVGKDKISIFDNGPGMDDSDENSLVKWGKMGASLHRSSKSQAIGGKPPYLKPYFGMFGYGGPIASMHLGRRALVCSKTKNVKKVYKLFLEREALLSASKSQLTWKTSGGIRDPSEIEIRDSNNGSFTKVVIYEPKVANVEVYRLQCHLKDIYFPYIQSDDMFNKGKTITPIEFQVNGDDLTEIQGGEVATTNLHSCNGPEFVLQLHLRQTSGIKSPSGVDFPIANARLRCVYFPFREGKENIEKILEKLKADGCVIKENFQSFSRVSIRRLGRLLPNARWSLLPFMDFRSKRGGNKAHLLKRCCLRVKCFIETDAGFKPTPSKTDLAHHNPFTTALKNLGSKSINEEKDIDVQILRNGKVLTPLQLEREYQDWIFQMHACYDEEVDSGEDQPVIIVSPANKKALGISSDVIRVHRVLKRKEKCWKAGQKIKVLKGACAGCHKNNIYATLDYFLLEGFEGDPGGDARIICRPIDVPDESGCVLTVGDKGASLDIHGSLSLPLSVIDSGKLVDVENIEWDNQLTKKHQKSPAAIDLLNSYLCEQLEVDGALPMDAPVFAGQVPPKQVVAVVRPANFMPDASEKLDQKYIFKSNMDMLMEVKFKNEDQNENIIHSDRASPAICKGFDGLYFFPLGRKLPNLFNRAGVYVFSFSLVESICERIHKRVIVKPSLHVMKWKHLSDDQNTQLILRVGSPFPTISMACYDIYDNRTPFQYIPEVTVKLVTDKDLIFEVHRLNTTLSTNKLTMSIKNVLVQCKELDKIRPSYGATLEIASSDQLISLSIPCRVFPGFLKHVQLLPPITENQLRPGYVFQELILEMFDAYRNHVLEGSEVTLSVDGFNILDHGLIRKVDDEGRIELSGLLMVTAGYGEKASISVVAEDKVIFKQEFSTGKRNLRITSEVPEFCHAGGYLENIDFEIVDTDGEVDTSIHHNDKDGQIHMLMIMSDSFNAKDSIRYTFHHGCCNVPSIPIPMNEGTFCFKAAHSRFTELSLIVKVPVIKALEVMYDACQPTFSDNSVMHKQDSVSLNQENNSMISLGNNDQKEFEELCKLGEQIGKVEDELNLRNQLKAETEHELYELLGIVEPCQWNNNNCLSTKDRLKMKIINMENTAAAVVCSLSVYQKQSIYFLEDIIGVVAELGTVQRPDLSRVLAEYLGEDTMLAIICRSFNTARSLESYKRSGEVDHECGLHAEAAALGITINKRFLVICLEDIRPCTERCQDNDPQRRLLLPDPSLSNGKTPAGFLGYAVNMVDLHTEHLQTKTASGHGLRETVLFSLFRKLQVYETRECMVAARACILDGAVSLDGGILREDGLLSLGHGNPFIYFPSENQMILPTQAGDIISQIEEKKSRLRMINHDIKILTKHHKKRLKKFVKRKAQYVSLLDRMEPIVELLECEPNPGNNSNMHS